MRRIVLIMLLWVGGLAVAVAAYQQQPRSKGSAIEKVKDNLYYIRGGDPNDAATFAGSNVIVFVTDAGVVLVDSMYPGHGREILDKVRSVTPKPVTMLINTHAHGDHTGSNTEFPATIDVLAHENAKAALSRPCDPTRPPCFIGDNAKFLPRKTFKDRMSLLSGRDQIDLYYFGRGHTNGDAWIVFPALGTMATGDMFSRKLHPPPISTGYGGSAVEFAETPGESRTGHHKRGHAHPRAYSRSAMERAHGVRQINARLCANGGGWQESRQACGRIGIDI